MAHQKHHHAGKSSRDLIDAVSVLRQIGLGEGDVFVDAGCGDGHFSVAAADFVGSSGIVYAVDQDAPGLEGLRRTLAQQHLSTVRVLEADLTRNLPIADETADCCLLANLMHGFVANGEVADALTQIGRVIKTGGILLVVDFKKASDMPGPSLAIRLTPEEVEDHVRDFGFTRERVIEAGPHHYGVVFRRGGGRTRQP